MGRGPREHRSKPPSCHADASLGARIALAYDSIKLAQGGGLGAG